MTSQVQTKFVTEPYSRNEAIAIDIKVPIKTIHYEIKGINNETYIVIITDLFSRFTEIAFVYDNNTSTVCKAIGDTWLKIHHLQKNA